MLQSVRFDHCGRQFELRPAWPASAAPLQDGLDRVEVIAGLAAIWASAPSCLQSCEPWRLRPLTADAEGRPGVLLRDAQVHATVSRMLKLGRLRLYALTRRMLADDTQAGFAKAPSLALTPSMLRAASGEAVAVSAAPLASPVPAVAIDHDRQAVVLRKAAANGVPFCEECERRRKPAELVPA